MKDKVQDLMPFYECVSVKSVDPCTNVLIVKEGMELRYMPYDASLTIQEAMEHYRDARKHSGIENTANC